MTKIRTVKPELFRHAVLFEAEQHSRLPLRLAFIGLFSCCDREGRFSWEPRSLKLDVLPYDDVNFADVLNALWTAGFIKKYTWQTKCYGYIPSWHQHQSINTREPASKLPTPAESTPEESTPELSVAILDTVLERCADQLPTVVQNTSLHRQTPALHEDLLYNA